MSGLRWEAMAVECKHCSAQYTEDGNGDKACAKNVRMVEEKYHSGYWVSSGGVVGVEPAGVRVGVGVVRLWVLDVTGIRFLGSSSAVRHSTETLSPCTSTILSPPPPPPPPLLLSLSHTAPLGHQTNQPMCRSLHLLATCGL